VLVSLRFRKAANFAGVEAGGCAGPGVVLCGSEGGRGSVAHCGGVVLLVLSVLCGEVVLECARQRGFEDSDAVEQDLPPVGE
jgi:hypothetical protein